MLAPEMVQVFRFAPVCFGLRSQGLRSHNLRSHNIGIHNIRSHNNKWIQMTFIDIDLRFGPICSEVPSAILANLYLCLGSGFDSSSLYTDNVHRDLVNSPGNHIALHFPGAGAEILWSVLKR